MQPQPARPPRARHLHGGVWLIESRSEPGIGHQVDATSGRCSCKGYQYRGHCAHGAMARTLETARHQMLAPQPAPRVPFTESAGYRALAEAFA